jgi:hypothetical protein
MPNGGDAVSRSLALLAVAAVTPVVTVYLAIRMPLAMDVAALRERALRFSVAAKGSRPT